MPVLEIQHPYLKRIGGKGRLCCEVNWQARRRTLWFEVDAGYEQYLCEERVDAFLVALLPFAMLRGLDMRSEASVSPRLLYQLNTVLIPSVAREIPQCSRIEVQAVADRSVLRSGGAVATAISCGVDSFHTVLRHVAPQVMGFGLTHLTYFNIYNSNLWRRRGEDCSREFSMARMAYVRNAALELGLPLVTVDSNFDAFYEEFELLATFSFRYFGTVLALQKLFSKYYWSSSDSFSRFAITLKDISSFDLLSVQCVSTENTLFYSTGSDVSRFEKTAYISQFPVTHRYLNVCWRRLHNCSQCDKCKRTMLALHALGRLEMYKNVFDVDGFYRRSGRFFGYLINKCAIENSGGHHRFFNEIYEAMKREGMNIPVSANVYALRERCGDMRDVVMKMARLD